MDSLQTVIFDMSIPFGQKSFTYTRDQFEELKVLLGHNSLFGALEVFINAHPCELDQVLLLWGPMAEEILAGKTWEDKVEQTNKCGLQKSGE